LWQEHAQREHAGKTRGALLLLLDALFSSRFFLTYLPIVFVTICMFCGASWQIFWSNTDPARYQCYALTFWLGSNATQLLSANQCAFLHVTAPQAAFHMLPLEYPPLTLLPFSLPLLAPLPYYQMAFAILMALTSMLIYWVLLKYGPHNAALVFALYLLLGAVAFAPGRFDLLPAAFTLLCLIAAERGHWTSAYVALAFGTLLKLYPVILLPVLFLAEQQLQGRLKMPAPAFTLRRLPGQLWYTLREMRHGSWRNCGIFLAIVLGITGCFALLNFQGAVTSQISYFAQRPIQVEASGSTLLWLAKDVGVPLQIAYTYGSLNIISRLDGAVSQVSTILLVMGYITIVFMQWRGKMDLTQAAIAVIFVFIATGKVFSPQYLIWLMPLLAYAGAFDMFWLLAWGAISLLTTLIYGYFYTRPIDPLLIPLSRGFAEAVTLRNGLFIFVTLAYLGNWFKIRQRKPLPPLSTGKETRPL
jgi:hypothetical protein